MSMTFTGLKALGKAVRQKSPIDLQMPVEMQIALLRLSLDDVAEPHSAAPSLSVVENKPETTEHADEDGNQTQETCLTA